MSPNCSLEACQFEKIANIPTLIFELLVIALSIGVIGYLVSKKNWVLLKRFGLIATGILIFELFTQPLWNNYSMSWWAYLYVDVSWILTLGWTMIIYFAWLITEKYIHPPKEYQRFFYTLFISAITGLAAEAVVISLGIRSYSPEVQEIISGYTPLFNIPLEAFFYIPLFMTLVISFVKYWELIINKIPIAPYRGVVHWKSVVVAFVGVFLYEVMNEPAVANIGWPEWSYIYHDVNLIRIILWVLILAIGSHIVNRGFYKQSPFVRFGTAVMLLTLLTIPLENWLYTHGMRQYGETLQSGFYGITIPGTNLPAEILFAVALYVTLIIAFVRYWVAIWDKDL